MEKNNSNLYTVLKVNMGKKIRPVTHTAAGSLYGVTEERPSQGILEALAPKVVVNTAKAGFQQPCGEALPVAKRLTACNGRVQVRLADWFTGWYDYAGWDDWADKVGKTVREIRDTGIDNIDGYEIWNEPDGSWKGQYLVPTETGRPCYVNFRIDVPENGIYTLKIHYANGLEEDAALHVCINKAVEKEVLFPPTGGWFRTGAVGDIIITAELHAGRNDIKLINGNKGFIELDYLDMEGIKPARYEAEAGCRGGYTLVTNGFASSSLSGNLIFNEFFARTCKEIHALDATAKIIGPSFCCYIRNAMKEFLLFQKEAGCLPDIMCWHQLADENFTAAYLDYRALEKELGICPIPVTINEYSGGGWNDEEGCPGVSAPLIAKFERLGVKSACISYWNGNPGALGSLLTDEDAPNGGYWFYKWYMDMSGDMLETIPEDPYNIRLLDGFACLEEEEKSAAIIFGGERNGKVKISVNNIPDGFGDKVTVVLEHTPFRNRFEKVKAPDIIFSTTYSVANGNFEVELETVERDGYRILIYAQDGKEGKVSLWN